MPTRPFLFAFLAYSIELNNSQFHNVGDRVANCLDTTAHCVPFLFGVFFSHSAGIPSRISVSSG